MKQPNTFLTLIFLLTLLSASCHRSERAQPSLFNTITTSKQTYIYKSPSWQAERIETLIPGAKIEVLQTTNRRWVRVRTPSRQVGWVEKRDILSHENYQEWQSLARRIVNNRPLIKGAPIDTANLRLRPGRNTVKLFRLREAESLDIFALAHTRVVSPVRSSTRREPSEPRYETWYLVRNSAGMVGWVLSRLINLDIPQQVLRYAEGKIIVFSQVIAVSRDKEGKTHPWYLIAERNNGTDVDFDRVRILYWNLSHNRYELLYRIKNLAGVLPIRVTSAEPGQPARATFTVSYFSEDGEPTLITEKYQLSGTHIEKLATAVNDLNRRLSD